SRLRHRRADPGRTRCQGVAPDNEQPRQARRARGLRPARCRPRRAAGVAPSGEPPLPADQAGPAGPRPAGPARRGREREVSGVGAPALSVAGAGELRVGVVAAQWHETVMAGLLAGAQRALTEADVDDPVVVRVPGSFELPV